MLTVSDFLRRALPLTLTLYVVGLGAIAAPNPVRSILAIAAAALLAGIGPYWAWRSSTHWFVSSAGPFLVAWCGAWALILATLDNWTTLTHVNESYQVVFAGPGHLLVVIVMSGILAALLSCGLLGLATRERGFAARSN